MTEASVIQRKFDRYDITRDGRIGVVTEGRYGYDVAALPVVIGLGMVRSLARDVADQIIVAARTSGPDPIAWVTNNAMVPPLRWFSRAEYVWQADNNRDGELWELFAGLVDEYTEDANVLLDCPECDNQLYAVDLARFEYVPDENAETLQGDWRARA